MKFADFVVGASYDAVYEVYSGSAPNSPIGLFRIPRHRFASYEDDDVKRFEFVDGVAKVWFR